MNPRLPAASKGSTQLITVLLKTLIFISNPYGRAFLAYLLAGLAVFFFLFFWLDLLSQFIYSTKGFSAVLWGKQVMIITYQSTQFIKCLLVFQGSAQRSLPGSSWLPRACPPRASRLVSTGCVSLRAIIFCISASRGLIFPAPGCAQSDRWRRSINTRPGGPGDGEGRDAASGSHPHWPPGGGRWGRLSRPLPSHAASPTCPPGLGSPVLLALEVGNHTQYLALASTDDAPEQGCSWWEPGGDKTPAFHLISSTNYDSILSTSIIKFLLPRYYAVDFGI